MIDTTGSMPRLARADRAKTLAFVGVADPSVLDPVVSSNRPTRNYSHLVFDTLYGLDTEWKAQPQMVEGHDVGEDGLEWTLRLREGLRFHDKEPVLARDVVGSIRRFAPRVIFASALMDATEEVAAPDDRTVRFRRKGVIRQVATQGVNRQNWGISRQLPSRRSPRALVNLPISLPIAHARGRGDAAVFDRRGRDDRANHSSPGFNRVPEKLGVFDATRCSALHRIEAGVQRHPHAPADDMIR